MSRILLGLILAYQRILRVYLWSGCRYHPSCSCYAKEAISKYGAGKGTVLALARILRCSPLFPGGYDPVK